MDGTHEGRRTLDTRLDAGLDAGGCTGRKTERWTLDRALEAGQGAGRWRETTDHAGRGMSWIGRWTLDMMQDAG